VLLSELDDGVVRCILDLNQQGTHKDG